MSLGDGEQLHMSDLRSHSPGRVHASDPIIMLHRAGLQSDRLPR